MIRAARGTLAAALAARVLGAASGAHAWEPVAGSKELAPRWSGPMIYRLNEQGSDDLDIELLLPELHKGMLEWTRPECTSATARYDGLTAELPSSDEEPGADNVIAWREADWTHGPEAVAVTAPSFIRTASGEQVIVAATMWLNGQHFTWVTGQSEGRRINLFSVILHEGGHYFGLGHTLVPMSVMNADYSRDLMGLAPDDIEGICSLYPLGKVEDCTAQPCPSGYACADGNCLCQADGGCAETGRCDAGPCVGDASCVVDGDCVSGEQRCVAGRCIRMADPPAAMCGRDGDCGADQACKAGICAAVDRTQPVGLPVGSDCVMDSDCESGLCRLAGDLTQCTAFCETDADCGTAARCQRDGTQTGLCAPVALAPEPPSPQAPANTRDTRTGGCAAVRASGSAVPIWLLLVTYVLRRKRRVPRG
jgi:hypothetical protein